jgi:hypothetical protein
MAAVCRNDRAADKLVTWDGVEPELQGLPILPDMPARPIYVAVEPNIIRRPWSFRSDSVFLVRSFEFPAGANVTARAE